MYKVAYKVVYAYIMYASFYFVRNAVCIFL